MAIDEKQVKDAVAALQQHKKGFSQSFDLIVALKDVNLKNPDEQVEFFVQLPNDPGKKKRICALVGPELIDDAKKIADTAVAQSEFEKLQKKDVRKLAGKHEYFLGQANIMPKIAQSFGRVLGPRGKMPNPKAGCIVPPKSDLKPIVERLQRTVKVSAKKQPNIQVMVGTQALGEERVVENILNLYNQIVHHLPKEESNVKHVYLKVTMSEPIRVK